MNQKSNNISKNILRIMPRQNIAHIPPPSSEHSSLWHQWMPQTITSQLNTSRQEIPWWLVSMINDLWFLERSILDWGWGSIRIIIISAVIIGSTEISKKTMEQGYKAKRYWFIRDLNRELLACVSLNANKKNDQRFTQHNKVLWNKLMNYQVGRRLLCIIQELLQCTLVMSVLHVLISCLELFWHFYKSKSD